VACDERIEKDQINLSYVKWMACEILVHTLLGGPRCLLCEGLKLGNVERDVVACFLVTNEVKWSLWTYSGKPPKLGRKSIT
jgi:hypothetical protein